MGSGPDDYACEIILEDLDRLVLGAWGKCLEIRVECCLGRSSVDWVMFLAELYVSSQSDRELYVPDSRVSIGVWKRYEWSSGWVQYRPWV